MRHARLWPRAFDLSRPTPADLRALTRLATEQERLPTERIQVQLRADTQSPDARSQPPAADHDDSDQR